MPRSAAACCVLCLVLVACLDVPPTLIDAAAPPPDAGPPRAEVVDVVAYDASGEAWPLSGVPRSVRLVARTTVGVQDMEDWVVLRGAPDDALRDDLAETPLRQANAARAVAAHRSRVDGGIALELDRLAAGDVFTVALLGRAATQDGRRFRDSWVATVTVSDAPRAGADVLASWPPDGAASVPADIDALLVRFDAPVAGDLVLEGVSGTVRGTTSPVDCRQFGWPNGFCLSVRPATDLPPGALRLLLGGRLVDGTGARPSPWQASLTVTAEFEDDAPSLLDTTCALDEIAFDGICVVPGEDRLSLRLRAAEPVRAFVESGGHRDAMVAPRGEVSLFLSALAPAADIDARLRLIGMDGRTTEVLLPLSTTERLLPLTLTEVRSDPHGREPAQELVEVLNFGDVALDLNGISVSDRPDAIGDVVAGAPLLAPGARALLVGDDFDPDATEDTPAPPGVTIVRVGRSLASGGLSNAGEPLFLRDSAMRRLSYAPPVATGEGRCLQRRDELDPRGTAFVIGACTPGRGP